jgi:pyruvate dehydrogenase E1 component alpha subunit
VFAASCEAIDQARVGSGPIFIESRTSRWPGTYGSSPTLEQSGETEISWAWAPATAPEGVRRWVEQSDPVLLQCRRLLQAGAADRDGLLAMDNDVRAEMSQAVQFALASPEPAPSSLAELTLAPALT